MLAWLLFLGALLAWAGVAFFSFSIQDMAASAAQSASDAATAGDRAGIAARQRSLAESTAAQRGVLETSLRNDPLAVASVIAQAGKDAGVPLHVSEAASEGLVGSSNALTISAVSFTVEASGSFASLVHAARLLETLSLPSSVEQLDIARTPGSSAGAWNMSVHMRVLTSLPVSS